MVPGVDGASTTDAPSKAIGALILLTPISWWQATSGFTISRADNCNKFLLFDRV